jgi:hypothetical protein
MLDGDSQPPVQIDPTLLAAHPALATVVVTRGSDLEGVSGGRCFLRSRDGGRLALRRNPLAASDHPGNVPALFLDTLFVPALPLAAKVDGDPLSGARGWIAPTDPQPVGDAALGGSTNDLADRWPRHHGSPARGGLACIGASLHGAALASVSAARAVVERRRDRRACHGRRLARGAMSSIPADSAPFGGRPGPLVCDRVSGVDASVPSPRARSTVNARSKRSAGLRPVPRRWAPSSSALR